jgi:hypothetical protein
VGQQVPPSVVTTLTITNVNPNGTPGPYTPANAYEVTDIYISGVPAGGSTGFDVQILSGSSPVFRGIGVPSSGSGVVAINYSTPLTCAAGQAVTIAINDSTGISVVDWTISGYEVSLA